MKLRSIPIASSVVVMACISAFPQSAATVKSVSACPIFLKSDFQIKEMKDGRELQVWYRDPDSNEFTPKLGWNGGTGFLVIHKKHYFLVTAKHVASSLPPTAKVILRNSAGGTVHLDLQSIMKNTHGAGWIAHPTADLAVHPFGYSLDLGARPCFFEEDYLDAEIEAPQLGAVYIYGFPLGLGTGNRYASIAKTTRIASWMVRLGDLNPSERPDMDYILIDDPISQGYSGSPIFAETPTTSLIFGPEYSPPVNLIGIASKTLSDVSGGKIGAVVPIKYLKELLNSAEVAEYERKNPIP